MKQCFHLASRSLLAAARLLLILSAAVAGAQDKSRPQPTAQLGTTEGGVAQEVVLGDLPQITAADMAVFKQPPFPRNPHFTDAQYEAAKMAAAKATVGSRSQDAGHMRIPQNPGADARGLTPGAFIEFLGQSQGCNSTNWTPSDMGLAVSKLWVVQTVNECIAVYNKAGVLQAGFPKDLCSFFGRAPNSGFAGCFDPRAAYDFQAKKFIIIASFQTFGGTGFVDLAVSTTSDPAGAWKIYHISRGAALPDYPTLGQTAKLNNALNSVITVCDNLFGNNGSFTAECLLINKNNAEAGVALGTIPRFFDFSLSGTLMDTIQPANVYELEENPRAQYAINSVNTNGGGVCGGSPCSGLVAWAFSDATGAQGAKASGIFTGFGSTSTYFLPGNADNAGFCSNCIETIDNRITGMVHYASGRLYPSIDTNNGGTSAILGWTVRPFLDDNGFACTGGVNCPALSGVTIEQEWCYGCGGGHGAEAYFGAQVPTPENDWTMFATFSSRGDFFNISPGQFYTSNRVSWLSPFHDSGIFTCQNNGAYTHFRWGDYAAAAPDIPGTKNGPATWGSGMYIQPNGFWGTCIAANRPQAGP